MALRTSYLNVRLSPDQRRRIGVALERWKQRSPGAALTLSDAVRLLLDKGLEAEERAVQGAQGAS